MSDEDLTKDLLAEGIDPEALLARGRLIVETKLKEAKLSWKRRARERIESFERTISSAKIDIPNSPSDAMLKIRGLLGSIPEGSRMRYAQFYSKMDKLTEGEAISVYQDLQKLKLLDDGNEGISDDHSGS